MRSLSSNELSLLRTRPQQSRFYLAVHRPKTVLTATLASVPNNFPGSVIQITNTNGGSISEAVRGMTVRVGSIAERDDYGTLRVRKASTGSALNVSEFGSGLVNFPSNACISIVEEYKPMSIHHSWASAASAWLVDFDPYSAQTKQYGPMAVMGPPVVGFMEGGKMTASFVGDMSYSFTDGVSITSQSWAFPDGQTVTSKLGSSLNPVVMTFVNASSGGRYFSLTVTDSNGASHVGYRLLFAFNPSAGTPHPVSFESINGGLRAGGYRTNAHIYTSGASQMFHDGTQVVIFERASYGTAGSSVGGNFPFRANNVLTGWIQNDTLQITPFTGEISFGIETIDGVLAKSDAYDLFLESGSAASAWDMASALTVDRAGIILAKYRSTIANVVDFRPAESFAKTVPILYQSLPQSSLWQQMSSNYGEKGQLGLVAADMQSALYAQMDAQVTGTSANIPLTMDVTRQDRRDLITIEHEHFDTVSQQTLYGVASATPLGAISPGAPAGVVGGRQEVTRGIGVDTQDHLITWSGNLRAQKNNPYKRVSIPLAGNMRIDSVPQSRITMSLSSNDNVRSLEWPNKVLLPYETTVNYNAQGGYTTVDITAETVVNGIGGSSITFPKVTTPISVLPTPDDISLPATTTLADGSTMYVVTTGIVARTRNFKAASPNYTNLTGVMTGTNTDFVLDPYDPKNTAYCLTTTTLWKTNNLDSTAPTWTSILSTADFSLPMVFRRVHMCTPTKNRVYVLMDWQNTDFPFEWLKYVVRSDNGGETFTAAVYTGASDQQAGDDGYMAFDVGDHNGSIVYIAGGGVSGGNGVYVRRSTDKGASWANYILDNTTGNTSSDVDVHLQFPSNSNDSTIWIWGGRVNGNLYKYTTSGGLVNTGITDDVTSAPENIPYRLNVFTGNANIVYALNRTTPPSTYTLKKSVDGGVTWTSPQTGLVSAHAMGIWPYDSNRIFFLTSTQIYYSDDGGTTITNQIGDWVAVMGGAFANPIMIVPVWIDY